MPTWTRSSAVAVTLAQWSEDGLCQVEAQSKALEEALASFMDAPNPNAEEEAEVEAMRLHAFKRKEAQAEVGEEGGSISRLMRWSCLTEKQCCYGALTHVLGGWDYIVKHNQDTEECGFQDCGLVLSELVE